MKIAILGTGLLGSAIAVRLLEKNQSVIIYNRTLSKTSELKTKGAEVSDSVHDAINAADVILLILSDANAIDEMLFQYKGSYAGKTFIQMGTIGSKESQQLAEQFRQRDAYYIECPVLGSRPEALSGNLILMIGSQKESYDKFESLFRMLGPNPHYIGEVGKAAALKLAFNQLIASHVVGFSFSLGLAEKSGVSIEHFHEILKESTLFAPMIEKKLSKWKTRDYTSANFPAKHLLKDIDLILEESKNKNLETSSIESIRQLFVETVNKGLADEDYSAVFEVINKI